MAVLRPGPADANTASGKLGGSKVVVSKMKDGDLSIEVSSDDSPVRSRITVTRAQAVIMGEVLEAALDL